MKKRIVQLTTSLILILFFLQSCAPVRMIGEHDEIVDNTIVQLQEKITVLLVRIERNLGTDKAKYENYTDNYDDIKVELNIIETRAAALEKYDLIYKQIIEVEKMVHNLEALHQMGFSRVEEINLFRQPFNSAFTAMVKLQLALKRGKN